jgi:hypothetical protein
MAACPLCRTPIEMQVVININLTSLMVTISEGTPAQIGPYVFFLPKAESRAMRVMRRNDGCRFAMYLREKTLQFLTSENIIFTDR